MKKQAIGTLKDEIKHAIKDGLDHPKNVWARLKNRGFKTTEGSVSKTFYQLRREMRANGKTTVTGVKPNIRETEKRIMEDPAPSTDNGSKIEEALKLLRGVIDETKQLTMDLKDKTEPVRANVGSGEEKEEAMKSTTNVPLVTELEVQIRELRWINRNLRDMLDTLAT